MNSKKIRTAAAAVLGFLMLLYVGYQTYLFTHKGIKTETASYGEVADTLQTRGFAIRKEEVIPGGYNGVLSYRVEDGARVSNGGVIADVYATEEDAAAQGNIARIDREIENLQQLAKPADLIAANPSLINSQIYTALNDISLEIQNTRFSELSEYKENLRMALSRKQIMIGEESAEDYSSRISALEAEKSSLALSAGSAVDAITAPAAGYFISGVDGLENIVDIAGIESITPEEAEELLQKEGQKPAGASIGKICSDFNWYVICVFNDNEMVKFEDVEQVNLDIPFASTATIPARVVAKNRDRNTEKTAVVFECSYMDADIACVRNETVQVNVKTYSGVMVNEKALHFCDIKYTETDENGQEVEKVRENVKGVYVQYGSRLKFVQVFSEKSVNGYAICKTELSDEELATLVTDSTVQLYDEIVTEGTDLYDGKLVR